MELILISMGVLGVTGFVAAVLLYVVSQLFKVEEDPRIDLVAVAVLPAAVISRRPVSKREVLKGCLAL
mgnify:CR=1 FL=1